MSHAFRHSALAAYAKPAYLKRSVPGPPGRERSVCEFKARDAALKAGMKEGMDPSYARLVAVLKEIQ